METPISITISFAVYTLLIVAVGIWSAKYSSRSTSDYLLADRKIGAWVTALSASASSESGWVTLGLVGTAFNEGVSAFWVVPGCLMGYCFNWWIMAKQISDFASKNEVYTVPDLMSALFKERELAFRFFSVAAIFTMMTAYVAAQFNAAGKAFEAVFHIPYESGVMIGAAIVLIYTILGGFRAVAWTDFVQGGLMCISLIILPLIALNAAGGWNEVTKTLAETNPSLVNFSAGKSGFFFLGMIMGWFGIGLGYPGQPHVIIRFMAVENEGAIRSGRIIAMLWGFFVFSGAVLLGVSCRAIFGFLPDSEQALPIIAIQLLPGIFAGLMLAAVLAAICSTADSQLLVASSSLSHDIYARLTEKDLNSSYVVNIDRIAVCLVGLLAMLLALTDNRVIFSFVLHAWAGLGAAFGPPLIMKLKWKGTTSTGALAGAIAGFVTVIAWKNIPALSDSLYELVPGFFIGLLVIWIVSKFINAK